MPPPRRRAGVLLVAVAVALGVGRSAIAQDNDPCLTAPVAGQEAQRAGRLLDARTQFAVCGQPKCPAEIVADCTRWARAVEEALPTVVVGAKDPSGRDLVDASVSVDGKPGVGVDARAIAVDPGEHRFVFHRNGAPDVEQRVLLREGEKNRPVIVTLVVPGAATASSAPRVTAPASAPDRPGPCRRRRGYRPGSAPTPARATVAMTALTRAARAPWVSAAASRSPSTARWSAVATSVRRASRTATAGHDERAGAPS